MRYHQTGDTNTYDPLALHTSTMKRPIPCNSSYPTQDTLDFHHLFVNRSFHRSHVCFRIVILFIVTLANIFTVTKGMSIQSNMVSVKQTIGSSALRQVQDLAQMVALANKSALSKKESELQTIQNNKKEMNNRENGIDVSNIKGLSGLVGFTRKRKVMELRRLRKKQKQNQKVVSTALESLERDSTFIFCFFMILVSLPRHLYSFMNMYMVYTLFFHWDSGAIR